MIHYFNDRSPASVTDALDIAGLNWDVESRRISTVPGSNGTKVFQGIVRKDTNTLLNVMKDRYHIIQNRDAFKVCDELVNLSGGHVKCAGEFHEGKKVFLQIEINQELEVIKGDKIQPYLTVATSHDGTIPTKVFFTAIRIVCQNTLTSAISNAGFSTMNIYHTSKCAERTKEASKILEASNEQFETLIQYCRDLQQIKVTHKDVDVFIDEMFPPLFKKDGRPKGGHGARERSRETLRNLIECGQGTELEGVRGTAWGMFNAATEMYDHHTKSLSGLEQEVRSLFYGGPGFRSKAINIIKDIVA